MIHIDNTKFYTKSIAQFGVSAQGVHWNSQFSQYKRFEVLTRFIKKEIRTSSLVDAGCGFAEYFNFLRKKELLPLKYVGLDCEEQMIHIAKKRFPKLALYQKNILEEALFKADYYVCSGAMNLLNQKELFQFIEQCYKYSTKGFAFNVLKQESFNHIEISDVLAYCKTLNGSYIFEDTYLRNDISIFLKKS